jgi:hypothetical protein
MSGGYRVTAALVIAKDQTGRLKHPGFDAHLVSCDRCASPI